MSETIGPPISENDLCDVAAAAAAVFEDTHLKFCSHAARAEMRRTIIVLVSASVLSYLRAVAPSSTP